MLFPLDRKESRRFSPGEPAKDGQGQRRGFLGACSAKAVRDEYRAAIIQNSIEPGDCSNLLDTDANAKTKRNEIKSSKNLNRLFKMFKFLFLLFFIYFRFSLICFLFFFFGGSHCRVV